VTSLEERDRDLTIALSSIYRLSRAACNLGGEPMEAYCFKCRAKREISSPQQVTLKNGRPATQGTCPVCSIKVFRIGRGQS